MKIQLQYLFVFCMMFSVVSYGQIISQFTWDADPVTAADVGPDATFVSSSAFSDVNGVGGTNGLNAGLPKRDIQMVIPGSPTFDVDGIDISFDFQRDESVCDFVRRGSSLTIDGSAQLGVRFRIEDGAGGYVSVSSGNVYPIPNDNTFRTYRFYYLPSTGEADLSVDGVSVWSYDGVDGRNMYWTGSGDFEVGVGCDGSGSNRTFLDNLIIANVFDSPLPIELVNFEARKKDENAVLLSWETASEVNNDFFTIERSGDGKNWEILDKVDGAGTSSEYLKYQISDNNPLLDLSYYRLKQTDFDGAFTYSDVESVFFDKWKENAPIVFPNPATNSVTVSTTNTDSFDVYSVSGKRVTDRLIFNVVDNNAILVDISELSSGVYFVKTADQVVQLIVD